MSPTAMPAPSLPAPVPLGATQGQKPKTKSTTPTILGDDSTANPTSSGTPTGKTFLGQ